VIAEINLTGYGLTFGIQSRIYDFINHVCANINAGNIYINRSIIGAVVGTHPFGGNGLSGTGPKAGGPNYLKRFLNEVTLTDNVAAIGGNLELIT
jgi:RHH-type proline utilization regulon transcriptional repressor/proline dehydrogenase/delta 1-pyrroline-5-carboxylate dehydrogenase